MSSLIKASNIRVKEKAADWEEAIRKAGMVLLSAGSITADYIDQMIQSVRELGPYIVLMPGLALAHAAPSSAVIHTDIALITLAAPVCFGSANDPVSVVLCLGCTDKTSHLENLSALAGMLLSETTVAEIAGAASAEEVTRTLLSRRT